MCGVSHLQAGPTCESSLDAYAALRYTILNTKEWSCQLTKNVRLALRSSFVAIALLSLLIFLALATPAIASPQGMRVAGVVHDPSGASVFGAQVELHTNSYSAKTITSTAGTFAFENVPGTRRVLRFGTRRQTDYGLAHRGVAAHSMLLAFGPLPQQGIFQGLCLFLKFPFPCLRH